MHFKTGHVQKMSELVMQNWQFSELNCALNVVNCVTFLSRLTAPYNSLCGARSYMYAGFCHVT
jgi:hypothetical protein